jgi:hypothetical protein
MPPRSPEPLRKVTLNLFDKDCDAMERRYGHGWSEAVREMVRSHLKERPYILDRHYADYYEEPQDEQ